MPIYFLRDGHWLEERCGCQLPADDGVNPERNDDTERRRMVADHFSLHVNEKAPLFRTAPNRRGLHFNGGAGIRTPVRDKIDHSVYVRIPPIEVSSRWPVDSPLLDKSSKLSPTAGRRSSRLSRICDTLKAASGGLL